MSRRLRVVGWRVEPILMLDDGINLTPLSVQPVEINAAQWDHFKQGGDQESLEQIRSQVEDG